MGVDSPYFVLLAIGLGLGCAWALRWSARLRVKRVAVIDVCLAAVIGGILGSRALHVAVEPLPGYDLPKPEIQRLAESLDELDPEGRELISAALRQPKVPAGWAFVAKVPPGEIRDAMVEALREDPHAVPAWLWYRAHPSYAWQFWRGGLAYLGGLGLAFVLCVTAARVHKQSIPDVADLTSPAIALGLIFGRIGCFLGGCCYGAECEVAWWSQQPSWYGHPIHGSHRYPTALLSALNALFVFLALRWLIQRRRFKGEVFLALLVLYAPGRYGIEAIRADPRGGAGGLSTSQLGVLVSGVPALLLWIALRLRSGEPLPLAEPEEEGEKDAEHVRVADAPPPDAPPPDAPPNPVA